MLASTHPRGRPATRTGTRKSQAEQKDRRAVDLRLVLSNEMEANEEHRQTRRQMAFSPCLLFV